MVFVYLVLALIAIIIIALLAAPAELDRARPVVRVPHQCSETAHGPRRRF